MGSSGWTSSSSSRASSSPPSCSRSSADTGRLDLAHFYDRRVRRLLPAALLVVLATGAVAVVMLSTIRRAPLVGDAQSALLYVANWRFLFQTNDYFAATEVGASPFLHFWSLSIEEQFYFFFPLVLIVLAKAERRHPGITVKVLLGLLALSVAAQVGWALVDANHAYYGTEARLYQLIAGSLLAMAFRSTRRPTFTRRAVGIGTVVSTAGMVLVAGSWPDVTPSVRGLLATVFAVGLVGSLAAQSGGLPERFFSLPPLVFLGKISYGTYLWHWPVVILLREVVQPGVVARTLLVVVLSTALATASYQMLERPVRSVKLPEALPRPDRDDRPDRQRAGRRTGGAAGAREGRAPGTRAERQPGRHGHRQERHRAGAGRRLRRLRPGQGRRREVLHGGRPRALRGGQRQPRPHGDAGRGRSRPDARADDDDARPPARVQPHGQHPERLPWLRGVTAGGQRGAPRDLRRRP